MMCEAHVDRQEHITRAVAVWLRHNGVPLFPHLSPFAAELCRFSRHLSGTHITIHNPFWWTALVICFVIGLVIARAWSGPLGVWIALAVTGLIPAGCLALFLALLSKLKQAQGGL
jgi:hypothetical protein